MSTLRSLVPVLSLLFVLAVSMAFVGCDSGGGNTLSGDGTFRSPQVSTHPESPAGGWGNSDFVVADLDNDGAYELVWSRVGNASNRNDT